MEPLKNLSDHTPLSFFNRKQSIDPGHNDFADTLKSMLLHVDRQIKDADQKAEDFALGKEYDLHEIMIASEKADLSFRLLLRIRNKLLDAYQEIMRMSF